MAKPGPKSGLAVRRDSVSAAGDLIKAGIGTERNSYELWKSITTQAKVANSNIKSYRKGPDGIPNWDSLSTHQKMKIAQDFLVTAFMTPEIGVRFLEAAMQDPLAMAKMTFSVMPKELHVDVQQQTGVVLLPMKAESLESWTKMVEGHSSKSAEPKDVSPDDFWADKLGGNNEVVDDDSTAGSVDGVLTSGHK